MKESKAMNSMELTSENVKAVFKDCLFRNKKEVEFPNMVEGIRTTVGLHPGRLEKHELDIVALCNQLPDNFKKSVGGGWSFLNLCMNNQGNQWTGDHADMEQLMILGLAIGKIELLASRSMWIVFPGGMPYLVVND